jgi:hypothetical protein
MSVSRTPPQRLRAAIEYCDTHLAACRYRAQGLVCSTCSDLTERVERIVAHIAVARAA